MAQTSSIEWTEATWNPVTGCTKVSPGCKYCYAERMAKRLEAMGQPRYRHGFTVTLQRDLLDAPLSWRKPRLIFVNSMSDLFHEHVPTSFIESVFKTMAAAPQHTFQILTKRPERLLSLADRLPWPEQIWAGVSVETEEYYERIELLRRVPSGVRFLSLEPLLSALPSLSLTGIDWVIAGGESGPGARPVDVSWVRQIRDQCVHLEVPFFFKQWGGVRKKPSGRVLDGVTWSEMPKPKTRWQGGPNRNSPPDRYSAVCAP